MSVTSSHISTSLQIIWPMLAICIFAYVLLLTFTQRFAGPGGGYIRFLGTQLATCTPVLWYSSRWPDVRSALVGLICAAVTLWLVFTLRSLWLLRSARVSRAAYRANIYRIMQDADADPRRRILPIATTNETRRRQGAHHGTTEHGAALAVGGTARTTERH